MTSYGNGDMEIGENTAVENEECDESGAVRLCFRMMSRTQSEDVPESPLKKKSSSGTSGKFLSITETINEELEQEREFESVSRAETGTSIESVFKSSSNPNLLKESNDVKFEAENSFCNGSVDISETDSNIHIHINDSRDECISCQELSVSEKETHNEKTISSDQKHTLNSAKSNSEQQGHRTSLVCDENHTRTCGHSEKSLYHLLLDKKHRASDALLNNPSETTSIHRKSSNALEYLLNIVNPIRRRSTDIRIEDNYWIRAYRCSDLFLALFGIGFFLADVVSDWRLAVLYYFDNQTLLFILTLSFIIVPSLISAVITIIWSVMDHQVYKAHLEEKKSRHMRRSNTFSDNLLLVLKVVFSLFQLGRCFRSFVFIVYVIKSWCTSAENKVKLHQIKKRALEQKHDAAILGLVDGFLESSSQFMLQMYLSISYKIEMDLARIVTICLSFISTALLHTSYYKNNRKVQKFKPNVGYLGGAIYFLWRLCELGPRLLLLVLFAYCFKFWVAVPTVLQLIVVFALFLYQKPKLKGICCTSTFDYLFCLLISYIGIFSLVNLKSGQTRYSFLIYYLFFYAENISMAVLVFFVCPELDNHIGRWKYGTIVLIPGFALHMFFMLLYYKSCHPRKKKPGSRGRQFCKDITLCGIELV